MGFGRWTWRKKTATMWKHNVRKNRSSCCLRHDAGVNRGCGAAETESESDADLKMKMKRRRRMKNMATLSMVRSMTTSW